MAFLLDADWAIQVLMGREPATRTLDQLAGQRIAISIITVAEIYEGAYNTANPQARLTTYRGFLSRFSILPVTDLVAEQFAETRAFLRRHGNLIPDMDLFLAATALVYDLPVLTFNVRHLARVPDLRIHRP